MAPLTMDCPRTTLPSLHAQTKSYKSQILSLGFKGMQNPSTNPHPKLQKSPLFPPKTQLGKLHFLQSPRPISSLLHYQFPSKISPCLCTPQNNLPQQNHTLFFKSFAVRLAVLVVGSLLFIGSFKYRPVKALPDASNSSSSAGFEEKIDAQKGKDEDEELYLKILEKSPRDVEALKVVLYGKMGKGKTKEAVNYVERLIDIQPGEVEWRLLQALSYELMGQLTKAKRLFKEILKDRPLLLRALHGLALVMHKNHEGPAVFEMLNNALELAQFEKRVTEERNIKILIAQMHVVKGDLEEALKEFQDLVNENPRDFRPYLCQGIIYSLLDKKKEADEQFETYRSLVPNEFPQRGFLDDVMLAAKTESQEQLQKDFDAEFSFRK